MTENLSLLKEEEVKNGVVCLMKVYGKYFVRVVTGVEGKINEIISTESLEEAEEAFKETINA